MELWQTSWLAPPPLAANHVEMVSSKFCSTMLTWRQKRTVSAIMQRKPPANMEPALFPFRKKMLIHAGGFAAIVIVIVIW
jgi:hypothetical protein